MSTSTSGTAPSASPSPSPSPSQTQAKAGSRPSVVDLIKSDHQTINQLYQQFNESTDTTNKLKLGQELIRAICVHSNAEEMVVYPLLDMELSKETGDHSRQEHLEVETHLYKIESASQVDENYVETMKKAMEALQKHVKEEETDILVKLAQKHTPEQLSTIGDQFQASKGVAPTRPHPSAPKSGLTALAAKLSAKPLDEMKDTVAGIQRTPVEESK